MLGAVAGDIIGSIYEHAPIKTRDFPLFAADCRFTDDTVLTIAVARAILDGAGYRENLLEFGRRYPDAGYGASFLRWLRDDDPQPYGSWGNGSAMRASPVGFACDSEEDVLAEARRSAAVTHDHPEGIKGAQAVALAVFFARSGRDRKFIRREIAHRFDYDLGRSVEAIRPGYAFDISCRGSVPEAIIAALDSDGWESAVRNAVSLGGDSDTLACIAGGIAEALYGGIPNAIRERTLAFLPADLRAIAVYFESRFPPRT
ncbi:MAG: ADP-ribosylglycohydrolase family protein [Desulfuromonadales bacterium]